MTYGALEIAFDKNSKPKIFMIIAILNLKKIVKKSL